MANFNMFGVDCAGCDDDADVDVTVYDNATGEVAKDVYACNDCADAISVPDTYTVTATAL